MSHLIHSTTGAPRAVEGRCGRLNVGLLRRAGRGLVVFRTVARFAVRPVRALAWHLGRDRALRRRFFGYGALSALLYALLFLYAREALAASSRTDGLFFLVPIAIALVFSFVHGAFTGYFWQALGVRGVRAGTGK